MSANKPPAPPAGSTLIAFELLERHQDGARRDWRADSLRAYLKAQKIREALPSDTDAVMLTVALEAMLESGTMTAKSRDFWMVTAWEHLENLHRKL